VLKPAGLFFAFLICLPGRRPRIDPGFALGGGEFFQLEIFSSYTSVTCPATSRVMAAIGLPRKKLIEYDKNSIAIAIAVSPNANACIDAWHQLLK